MKVQEISVFVYGVQVGSFKCAINMPEEDILECVYEILYEKQNLEVEQLDSIEWEWKSDVCEIVE